MNGSPDIHTEQLPPKADGEPTVASNQLGRDNAKFELEIEKLSLEKRVLRRQLTWQGIAWEWLKAAAVPVTLLGAFLAFYVGFNQLKEAETNRLAERFDNTLTRLASDKIEQRMTGVAGLRLFLNENDDGIKLQSLQFLINALSLETDRRVQGAMLDMLQSLTSQSIEQSTLDDALTNAIERNRNITASIISEYFDKISSERLLIIKSLSEAKAYAGVTNFSDVPDSFIGSLNDQDYFRLLKVAHGPFDRLKDDVERPLTGLAKAISLLIRAGAKSKDFTGIFCERCNFSTAQSLDYANFDRSYLSGADFQHLSLRNASFKDTDIGGAIFFGSTLQNAVLTRRLLPPTSISHGNYSLLPQFECADLSGADLSGLPLILIDRLYDSGWGGGKAIEIVVPRMAQVKIDEKTKLNEFQILSLVTVADEYYQKNKGNPEVKPFEPSNYSNLVSSPLIDNLSLSAEFRRNTYKAGSSSAYLLSSSISAERLPHLLPEALYTIDYVDRAGLARLPIVKQYVDKAKLNKKSTFEDNSKQESSTIDCNAKINVNALSRLFITDGMSSIDLSSSHGGNP